MKPDNKNVLLSLCHVFFLVKRQFLFKFYTANFQFPLGATEELFAHLVISIFASTSLLCSENVTKYTLELNHSRSRDLVL